MDKPLGYSDSQKTRQFEYPPGPADSKNRTHQSMYQDQFVRDEGTCSSVCCGLFPMKENSCGMQPRAKHD
ncbi:MAG: hypothetical protein WBZ20_07375, partial [Nitrososphaeraceae archaeon]